MLSFKILSEENGQSVLKEFSGELSSREFEMLEEISLGILDGIDEDSELAVSVGAGCALFRIFDMGRYVFLFPYEISENADIKNAVSLICEYATKEEIPIFFSDVPGDLLAVFAGFRHIDFDAEDRDCECYSVRIKTECDMISDFPSITVGRVTLNALREEDISSYAKLSKDRSLNEFWGYDYKEDIESPTDEYFYDMAMREFSRGVAMSLAIRCGEEFIGEAVIYSFDGKGGAEFAIRIRKAYQGKGYGSEAMRAVAALSKKIGLVSLRARIMKKNVASIKMTEKFMSVYEKTEDEVRFFVEI